MIHPQLVQLQMVTLEDVWISSIVQFFWQTLTDWENPSASNHFLFLESVVLIKGESFLSLLINTFEPSFISYQIANIFVKILISLSLPFFPYFSAFSSNNCATLDSQLPDFIRRPLKLEFNAMHSCSGWLKWLQIPCAFLYSTETTLKRSAPRPPLNTFTTSNC